MNQHTVDPRYTEARQYAFAKPGTNPRHLRERFEFLSPEQCRKLMYRAREDARKTGVEIKTHKAGAVNELYSLAKAHGFANPTMTPTQLRQLFPVDNQQSQKIMCLARKAAGVAAIPAAQWPIERKPNPKQAAIMEAAAKRREEAAEYVKQNPNVYVSTIAKMFRVPTQELSKLRASEQQRIAAERASKPRRKVNRLHAVMCDGSMVDPKRVRDWKCVIRFEKVVV